jgi:hypothetical protein
LPSWISSLTTFSTGSIIGKINNPDNSHLAKKFFKVATTFISRIYLKNPYTNRLRKEICCKKLHEQYWIDCQMCANSTTAEEALISGRSVAFYTRDGSRLAGTFVLPVEASPSSGSGSIWHPLAAQHVSRAVHCDGAICIESVEKN